MNILETLQQLQNGQPQQNDQGNDDDFVMPQQVQDDNGGRNAAARRQKRSDPKALARDQLQLRKDYWSDFSKYHDQFDEKTPYGSIRSPEGINREYEFVDTYGDHQLPEDPGMRVMENFNDYKFGDANPGSQEPSSKDFRYLEADNDDNPYKITDFESRFGRATANKYRKEYPETFPGALPNGEIDPSLPPSTGYNAIDEHQNDLRNRKKQNGIPLTDEELQEELQYNMKREERGKQLEMEQNNWRSTPQQKDI